MRLMYPYTIHTYIKKHKMKRRYSPARYACQHPAETRLAASSSYPPRHKSTQSTTLHLKHCMYLKGVPKTVVMKNGDYMSVKLSRLHLYVILIRVH